MNTSIIALVALVEIASPENVKIAESIAFAESCGDYRAVGDCGVAYGAYQMHKVAWDDCNAFRKKHRMSVIPWYNKRYKGSQDIMAMTYIEIIRRRFVADFQRQPLPKEVYMAYTMGYQGAKDVNFEILRAPEVKQRGVLRFMEKFRSNTTK
jgi:hypothetical protein